MNSKRLNNRLSLSLKWFISFLFLLMSATWALGVLDLKYHTESTLGFKSGFPGLATDWSVSGISANFSIGNDFISFSSREPGKSEAIYDIALDKHALASSPLLRGRSLSRSGSAQTLEGDIKNGTSNGAGNAALLLRFLDKDKNRLLTRRLAKLNHIPPVTTADNVFHLPASTQFLRIAIVDRHSGADFEVRNLVLEMVTVSKTYLAMGALLMLCWLVLLAAALVWMKKRRFTGSLLLIAGTLCLLSAGMLLPKSLLADLMQHTGVVRKEAMFIVYNGSHYLLFALLSLFTFNLLKQEPFGRVVAMVILAMIAVATEGFQLHFSGRSASTNDLLFDMAGIFTGFLVYTALSAIWNPDITR